MSIQPLAIVNTRVSTAEQMQNNSLNRQQESVEGAAKRLGAIIPADGRWSGSVSSKAGTNVKRKDLLEMLAYCKTHKAVKYAIFDEYDRFMRSVNEGAYFEVLFQQLGVKVWYASETDAFNGDDAMAKFMRSMSAFKAEGSNEERQRKSIHGHEKAIREGRYTFPPKPGYMKSSEPGVHIPDPRDFEALQRSFKEVVSGLYSPTEALKRLNESEFNRKHAEWRMDKFRRFATDPYYAGIVEIHKQANAKNSAGLHKAMLSIEEHESLLRIFNGKLKIRGPKKQYNPEFPMNKLLLCGDCGEGVKFTGSKKNNGYKKSRTSYYWKYHCRGCGRGYHRAEVHEAITNALKEITYSGAQQSEFIEALNTVWQRKKSDELQARKAIQKKISKLEEVKESLIVKMAMIEEQYEADFKAQLDKVKIEIETLQAQADSNHLQDELLEFTKFALDYTSTLARDWWELSHEDRIRCQQLIIPGGISFNSHKKVGTLEISPIYRLDPNKKDLSFNEKSLMVELVGTAPTSAGVLVSRLQA